jgi:NADP-dependent aldehyde dehydrogenase
MPSQSVNPVSGKSFGPVISDTSKAELEILIGKTIDAQKLWSKSNYSCRAKVLIAIADTLDRNVEDLAELANSETGLGLIRLTGEIARTSFQFREFADEILKGKLGNASYDAEVEAPLPKGHPSFLKIRYPLGVVAVFGASNFPFAFGVLGGDTASAVAAGCCVVAKGHPSHPQTSLRLIELAQEAIASVNEPSEIISIGFGIEFGKDLVRHKGLGAVCFTGSKSGGQFLSQLSANRESPIPFYGELGSINPVIATASFIDSNSDFGQKYLDSLFLGNGQFCTKPSVLFVPSTSNLDQLFSEKVSLAKVQPLLSANSRDSHDANRDQLISKAPLQVFKNLNDADISITTTNQVLVFSSKQVIDDPSILRIECFGPTGVVVKYESDLVLEQLITRLDSALVGSIFSDKSELGRLVGLLLNKVGRIAVNAWPTGVSVTAGQHHGGSFPASTSPLHTSVGRDSMLRFLRPVTVQGVNLIDAQNVLGVESYGRL